MFHKKKLGMLFLTGTLLLGMYTTAFAQEGPAIGKGTEDSPATVSITKNLELAEGLDIPNAAFEFTVKADSPDAPNAAISPIVYDSAEDQKGSSQGGKYVISKKAVITFEKFTKAGEYRYIIEEKKGTMEGITYSEDQYALRVQVANGEKGLYVKSVTAEKVSDSKKVAEILFTNTYRKSGSLTIEKTTTGESADQEKDFDFTITFTRSATETDEKPVYTGKIGEKAITCPEGSPVTFQLHGGEKLVFDSLLAGTRYEVKETGVKDNYFPSVQVTENGVQESVISKQDEEEVSTSQKYIGEKENHVRFTNTHHTVPLTGIFMNYLPFILLIAVAVLALGTLGFIKRHRASKKS